MRSSNPILNEKAFDSFTYLGSDTMTVQGTVNKALIMFALLLSGAAFTWMNVGTPLAMPLMIGGAIGGFLITLAKEPHLFIDNLEMVILLAIPIVLLFILAKLGKI